DLADLDAGLATLRELERRLHQPAGATFGLLFQTGWLLAVVLDQRRLGVERIDLRRATVHEEVDDALGLRLEVRLLRRQRVVAAGDERGGGAELLLLREQGSQSERPQTRADAG